MRSALSGLVLFTIAIHLTGCFGKDDGDNVVSDGGILNDQDSFPATNLFNTEHWPAGSGFSPSGDPAFDVQGKGKDVPVGVAMSHSDPSLGTAVPYDWDDIKFVGYGVAPLSSGQINFITASYNNGRPNKTKDVVVIPSLSTLTPPNERYYHFEINVKSYLEALAEDGPLDSDPPRTHVVGIAFGNGQGGYVPAAPNTADSFAGAQVWMKATRVGNDGVWAMDQADWTRGYGNRYGSSMRLLIRGGSAIAIVREDEMDRLAVNQFRWDVFSYTANPRTDWSHDYTDWVKFR